MTDKTTKTFLTPKLGLVPEIIEISNTYFIVNFWTADSDDLLGFKLILEDSKENVVKEVSIEHDVYTFSDLLRGEKHSLKYQTIYGQGEKSNFAEVVVTTNDIDIDIKLLAVTANNITLQSSSYTSSVYANLQNHEENKEEENLNMNNFIENYDEDAGSAALEEASKFIYKIASHDITNNNLHNNEIKYNFNGAEDLGLNFLAQQPETMNNKIRNSDKINLETVSFTNLSPSTSYTIYIRKEVSEILKSDWTPFEITTGPQKPILNLVELQSSRVKYRVKCFNYLSGDESKFRNIQMSVFTGSSKHQFTSEIEIIEAMHLEAGTIYEANIRCAYDYMHEETNDAITVVSSNHRVER